MHIQALKGHLIKLYGEPTVLERQNAYRWQIDSLGPMPVYICLTIEELTRRASVWIFDPNGTSITPTTSRWKTPSISNWQ